MERPLTAPPVPVQQEPRIAAAAGARSANAADRFPRAR